MIQASATVTVPASSILEVAAYFFDHWICQLKQFSVYQQLPFPARFLMLSCMSNQIQTVGGAEWRGGVIHKQNIHGASLVVYHQTGNELLAFEVQHQNQK